MDRSNSLSSNSSNGSKASSCDPFPYQTRLLERTSSLRNNKSLSRSSSLTGSGPSVGSNTASHGTRRPYPTHRFTTSLDVVRGKWEERATAEALLDTHASLNPSDSTRGHTLASATTQLIEPHPTPLLAEGRPSTPPTSSLYSPVDHQTLRSNKRNTMPAPLRALSSTPSSNGGSVDNLSTPTPARAHLPSPSTPHPSRLYSTHRVSNSLDAVRGKWEERAAAESILDDHLPVSVSKDLTRLHVQSTAAPNFAEAKPAPSHAVTKPTPFIDRRPPPNTKRHTMPAPICASPLSSNSTASFFDNTSPPSIPSTSTSAFICAPSPTSSFSSRTGSEGLNFSAVASDPTNSSPPSRFRRSNTIDCVSLNSSHLSGISHPTPLSSDPSIAASHAKHPPTSFLARRPTSVYGNYDSTPPSPTKSMGTVLSRANTFSSSSESSYRISNGLTESPSSALQTRHSSSYLTNKKAPIYGDQLTAGRRLGMHLPRIVSGVTLEDWEPKAAEDEAEEISPADTRFRQTQGLDDFDVMPSPPRSKSFDSSSIDDVAGVPGRLRFNRDKAPSTPTSPLPSARLARWGLWADTQRHLLLAYEYLCHVGEAQQWIEGCLNEELGFGVVEMEESLRNGVVLAKLVRKFQGRAVVKKIYEAPKLDYRHSDNINYFFNFVRDVGLPECFVFELTDLYDKKNMPKVIYCIHALSHLLARRGLAERIGNLLGHLKFSDDQLQRTQKGLKESGVPMPNFGDVGRELAKKINEEPDVETEDERLDRLLLDNEGSIITTQCIARGYIVRRARTARLEYLRIAERHILQLQAHCRGSLVRRRWDERRRKHTDLTPWVICLQAASRALLRRRYWHSHLCRVRSVSQNVIQIQAQARGVIQRRRLALVRAALRSSRPFIVRFQAMARARITKAGHTELKKTFVRRSTKSSIVMLQAHARGVLIRSHVARHLMFTAFGAHCRGFIVRRRMKAKISKLENVSSIVVRMQAAARAFLVRRHLLVLIRGLRKATPVITGLQAHARANLARQHHQSLNKAFATVQVVTAVGSIQALARAALARNRHREQKKELEFWMPDVVGLQAVCRGALLRADYQTWLDHLSRNEPLATVLQAMLRGALIRRKFRAKLQYYHANLDKVVKIQSLYRAKETREQYRQLTLGTNVSVGTIKNFVHLLDDSEADFQDEIRVERLRKKVVEGIRENQALESEVNELDVRIALVVQNVKSKEELVKARRLHGADSAAAHAARASVLAAHGDPFAKPNTLDHAAKRKLELYQQLFYLLQTKSEYLCRLFTLLSSDGAAEKNRRLSERVVLTLFGYGQDRREHYLLLKLLQHAIHDEISSAGSIDDIIHGHPMYINIAVHYIRPKQLVYVREALQNVICEVVASDNLDLEADPTVIHRTMVELEEMRSGLASSCPKDVPFYQALEDYPMTRAEYIRHLQLLQGYTEAFVTAILQSTRRMPFGMRFLARETLVALRSAFPDSPPEAYSACISRLVFYRYINPAIITPEIFNIVAKTVDVVGRKNLSQVSSVITQITSGAEFNDDKPAYLPINMYVRKAIAQMVAWFMEVADVPDAESQFHAHEFLDATVQPKPIYISPNEVYAMHSLLSQYLDKLAPNRDDTLRVILNELKGVPNLGTDELKDARDREITLELTNRFAQVWDPQADEKALWVQAKRGVLAILRVQPAENLFESLMHPVTDDEESKWDDILEMEMEMEQTKQHPGRMPSATAGDAAYRLEDIRSLSFREVKLHTIGILLELEKQGNVTRKDGFQGILNAIAGDVRSKHRKRVQRQQEIENMNDALKDLAERKKYFEEQINSYHDYVEAAMHTMQRGKGKKRFVLPFTKQFFHLRDLQKAGKSPQFGSFKYGARDLYEKGILLSIDQYSPRQFDKIDLIISSNKAGIFTLEIYNSIMGFSDCVASTDIRMEDLLQGQFENRASLSLFNGMVKMNLNLFLYQINKKFYI